MKVLITGGSGLLGQYLNIFLSKKFEILSLYLNNSGNCIEYNSKKVDICNYRKIFDVISSFKPQIIVHTAAYSKPEIVEKLSFYDVYKINVEATKYLAELSELNNAKIIFTSTDLVYDGVQGSMIPESGKINPISVYAKTKFLAEQIIRKTTDNYIILRTSLLYGLALNNTSNYFTYIFNNLQSGKPVRLFYDQYRTPLSLINASILIEDLILKDVKSETINFGGLQRVSRLELAQILCNVGGFDKSLLEKISMDDVPEVIKVPDVSLDTKKLQAYTSLQKTIEESIEEIIKYGKN